jgi:hypothetical protein
MLHQNAVIYTSAKQKMPCFYKCRFNQANAGHNWLKRTFSLKHFFFNYLLENPGKMTNLPLLNFSLFHPTESHPQNTGVNFEKL